jgi:hypothetical protein
MGWNSRDRYGATVTEEEVLANAAFMRDHLLAHGRDTVVLDVLWHGRGNREVPVRTSRGRWPSRHS